MAQVPSSSPITGVIEEEFVFLDFGKYEGRTVRDIAEMDPDFYARLRTEKERGTFAIRRQQDKTFRLYINPMAKVDS